MIYYPLNKKKNGRNIIKNGLKNNLSKGNKNEKKTQGNTIKIDIIT